MAPEPAAGVDFFRHGALPVPLVAEEAAVLWPLVVLRAAVLVFRPSSLSHPASPARRGGVARIRAGARPETASMEH